MEFFGAHTSSGIYYVKLKGKLKILRLNFLNFKIVIILYFFLPLNQKEVFFKEDQESVVRSIPKKQREENHSYKLYRQPKENNKKSESRRVGYQNQLLLFTK